MERKFIIEEGKLRSVITYLNKTNLPHQDIINIIKMLSELDELKEKPNKKAEIVTLFKDVVEKIDEKPINVN